MKIPESIIEKYQLVPSGEQVGASFMNNLIVYESKLPELNYIRFIECDMQGEPTDGILLFNRITRKTAKITEAFDMIPVDKIHLLAQ